MRPDAFGSSVGERRTRPTTFETALPGNSPTVPRLVSVDVFDTLLLRSTMSEQERMLAGERAFAAVLARDGFEIDVASLLGIRRTLQRLAFRALGVGGVDREVRLIDLVERQLILLGAPTSLSATRIAIEAEIERSALRPNRALAALLAAYRASGTRVVAISDTTLPGETIASLITAVHGRDVVDTVYSSADEGCSKRAGGLFQVVADREGVELAAMRHMGDDPVADLATPRSLGIAAELQRRPNYLSRIRRARGGWRLGLRKWKEIVTDRLQSRMMSESQREFGRDTLGPIVAEFCARIWMYVREAETHDPTILLFCARGGIGIRTAFEAAVARYRLPMDTRRENLVISRLIAARAALMQQSRAAIEELNREFRGKSHSFVARALASRTHQLRPEWEANFEGGAFVELLFGPGGEALRDDIASQNALFLEHLHALCGDAKRVILCDTGLFGSTQRMLSAGIPHVRFETIQLARANYKGHDQSHFDRTVGLETEHDRFSPLDSRSYVLRYWQLIESLFEPDIPSARFFSRYSDGTLSANIGDIEQDGFALERFGPMLHGVLDYIERDGPAAASDAIEAAESSWSGLRKLVSHPTPREARLLGTFDRSIDFGRDQTVATVGETAAANAASLRKLRQALWREGAMVTMFPRVGSVATRLVGPSLVIRRLLRGIMRR